jgi:GWxTD domain-containing protein
MRRAKAVLGVATFLLASFAVAELSPKYQDWPDGPAGLLMTKQDRKEYKKLDTDAQAEQFIALFWARRDPNLDTSVNEFKREFNMRVAAADKIFGFGKVPGWDSDRGRTLVLMGKPTNRSAQAAGQGSENLPGAEGDLEERGGGGMEIWEYGPAALPARTEADHVYFIFRESRIGYNDYTLDRRDPRNAKGIDLLAEAPERYLLHPKLTEVPSVGLAVGSKAATPGQLAVFAAAQRPWPEGAAVITDEGAMSANNHPLWLWVQLPDAVPAASQAIGRATNVGTGEEVGTFAVDVQPITVPSARGYELSLPLDAGEFKVDIALLGMEGPLAVTSIDATVKDVPAEGEYISPFIWGAEVHQNLNAKLTDAFDIGGWHVIPRVGDTFTTEQSLNYFCTILRPTLDAQGEGKFTLGLALYLGERKLTETPPQPARISQIGGDLWMLGNALPLNHFHKAGQYKLVVTINDTLSNASRSTEIPLNIQMAGGPEVTQEKP